MKLPELKIGNLIAKTPIVQGGMGVGISLSSLAGAVSLNGGIGVISGVEIGFNEPDFSKNKKAANFKALKFHINRARDICKGGVLGINIMTALNNFDEMVIESVKQKIDIIFSGAGLPLRLPQYTKGTATKIAPIVSSGRAAAVICKSWDKHYHVVPDAIVVEGPLAGGHLGFSPEELSDSSHQLMILLKDVLEVIKPFEHKYIKNIPVIAGGGVFSGKDIAEVLHAGASGVQMATRFVATDECDASEQFKQAYVNAKAEDIEIIQSPLGMIGRAIRNNFLDAVEMDIKRPVRCLYHCLKPCKPATTPYCIADALINAQKGNLRDGFAFAGANVHKIKTIIPVKELIRQLVEEAEQHF